MQTPESNKRNKLKQADRDSIERLIRSGSREAAIKLYAGACNCELDEARQELLQLVMAWRSERPNETGEKSRQ